MVVKKQTKEEKSSKEVKKEPARFGIDELAQFCAVSKFRMDSYFKVLGLDKDAKLTMNEAEKRLKNLL